MEQNNDTWTSDEDDDDSLSICPTSMAILCATIVVALASNACLVLVIVCTSKRRYSSTQVLILHTCAADIVYAMGTILPQLLLMSTTPYFYFGDLACRLIKYVQLVPQYASPYLILALTINRYLAVCKPLLMHRWKKSACHWLAFLAWTIACVFSAPNLFIFGTVGWLLDQQPYETCTSLVVGSYTEVVSVWFFVLTDLVVPTLLATVLYSTVCQTVLNNCKMNNASFALHPPTSSQLVHSPAISLALFKANWTQTAIASVPSESSRHSNNTSLTGRRFYKVKTIKMAFMTVVGHFALLAPFCLANLIVIHSKEENFGE